MKTRNIAHPVRLRLLGFRIACVIPLLFGTAQASIAYGSINNFDTVNDTGRECHGFEIELEDCHSTDNSYTLAMNVNHSLVANFAATYSISTSALPLAGGTTTGGGIANDGDSVTVVATANGGYAFTNWTEGGLVVSATVSYTFNAADRVLVANFVANVGVFPTTGIHETENENEMEFEWPETAAGWVLQESTDLSHWVNSTRQIITRGGKKHTRVSTLNVPGVFFRLVKP